MHLNRNYHDDFYGDCLHDCITMVSAIMTNIVMIFIIAAILSLKANNDNDSCNDNDE